MAFTVTMLSWSAAEYGEEIVAAGEERYVLEAIKWGTDYFLKAHTEANVLWAEVGDGDTDHYCWQRPEDMTTPRQAYKIDSNKPGSDLAGETAAAMAAASLVFRKSHPHYSDLLLHHAEQLFEFGDKHRGNYDKSVEKVRSYYGSVSGYMDELLWAALWLHRATGRREYLDYAVTNAVNFGGTEWAIREFSWDLKYAGIQVLAARILLLEKEPLPESHEKVLKQYQEKAEHYLCSCLNKNNNGSNVLRTPGGLLFVRPWNNMQYVSTAAFLLTIYSDYLAASSKKQFSCHYGTTRAADLIKLAKRQTDYILGDNPHGMSYFVGFGRRYPTRVHHRGASIVSYKESHGFIGCTQGYDEWYSRRKPNPNVIWGAIVGGPGLGDEFEDERGNYMQTEACTYNTAPMVGVFAKLYSLAQKRKKMIPLLNEKNAGRLWSLQR
ncbi:endoglucanase 22 [Phalaenopsis equestris]|uniref:endoglucanase 22 n=1 Tax=Phalaenopsis equestris TaxID=78828 RepID=UPI0009E368D9|nr:endoglucanase 22 [Phalaenopsis equestris]